MSLLRSQTHAMDTKILTTEKSIIIKSNPLPLIPQWSFKWCTPILGMGVSTTTQHSSTYSITLYTFVHSKSDGICKKIGLLVIICIYYYIFASLKRDFLAFVDKKYMIRGWFWHAYYQKDWQLAKKPFAYSHDLIFLDYLWFAMNFDFFIND